MISGSASSPRSKPGSSSAGTATLPSRAYESVVENANGSWTITWNLPELAPSDEYTVTFPTRTRRFYQQNFANDAANPVRAGDSWTNRVEAPGTDFRS